MKNTITALVLVWGTFFMNTVLHSKIKYLKTKSKVYSCKTVACKIRGRLIPADTIFRMINLKNDSVKIKLKISGKSYWVKSSFLRRSVKGSNRLPMSIARSQSRRYYRSYNTKLPKLKRINKENHAEYRLSSRHSKYHKASSVSGKVTSSLARNNRFLYKLLLTKNSVEVDFSEKPTFLMGVYLGISRLLEGIFKAFAYGFSFLVLESSMMKYFGIDFFALFVFNLILLAISLRIRFGKSFENIREFFGLRCDEGLLKQEVIGKHSNVLCLKTGRPLHFSNTPSKSRENNVCLDNNMKNASSGIFSKIKDQREDTISSVSIKELEELFSESEVQKVS